MSTYSRLNPRRAAVPGKAAARVITFMVLFAMLLARPNIWGESYSVASVGVLVAAAFVALVQDRFYISILGKGMGPLRSTFFWLILAYLWLLLRASSQGSPDILPLFTGAGITIVSVFCLAVIVADRRRAVVLAKGFVFVVAACCFSYAVTVLVWSVSGIGGGSVGSVLIGSWPMPQPVYFPFTTTVSTQPFFGVSIPRFVGFGREPGWMALYIAIAYLLMPLLGWRKRIVRLVLLMGAVGTVSTAGFGVLIACMALNFTLNGKARTQFERFLLFSFGLIVLGAALWAAIYAPVLGLNAKGEQNAVSLEDRSAATDYGLWALMNDPFSGGLATDLVGAVNLIAAVASYGLPFSIFMSLAVVGPILWHNKRRLFLPFGLAFLLTLGLSQPALDSAWLFCLVVLTAAVAMHPAETQTKLTPQAGPKKLKLPVAYQRQFSDRLDR